MPAMSQSAQNKRQILRVTSIIGGATFAALLISLLKMKLIAVLVGTAGVGLLGALTALMTTGASIAGMGIESSAVRQLSVASHDTAKARVVRFAIWTYAWPLAIAGATVCWVLREPLGEFVTGSTDRASDIGWLSLGVGLSVLGAAQLAQVHAYRRMGDLARIRIWSALFAAGASVLAVYLFSLRGVIIAILATPLALSLVALWHSKKLPALQLRPRPSISKLMPHWRSLAALGALVMVAAVIGNIGQLIGRSIIVQRLGLSELGLFQAGFTISSLNVGLLLGAMTSDYFPRLSAEVNNHENFNRVVHEQVHVGLIIAAPLLPALALLAPLVLQVLYTREFTEASLVLRLLILGDAMRLLGWALGFALLARQAARSYLIVELTYTLVFLPTLWLLLPLSGIAAAGVAHIFAYLLTLTVSVYLCSKNLNLGVDRKNAILLFVLVVTLALIASLSLISEMAAMMFGAVAVAALGFYSLRELSRLGSGRLRLPKFIQNRLR